MDLFICPVRKYHGENQFAFGSPKGGFSKFRVKSPAASCRAFHLIL